MCEFKAGCPYTRIPPTTRTTSAQTTMIAVAEDGAELRMTVPEVEFDLTEYLAHDETGSHMWRFDDSRRWARREPSTKSSPGHGLTPVTSTCRSTGGSRGRNCRTSLPS